MLLFGCVFCAFGVRKTFLLKKGFKTALITSFILLQQCFPNSVKGWEEIESFSLAGFFYQVVGSERTVILTDFDGE